MREALIVAMHDAKNVVYVKQRETQELAARIAPQHRPLFKDIERIECNWWQDKDILKLYIVTNKSRISMTYQGSYTVVFAPEPPA